MMNLIFVLFLNYFAITCADVIVETKLGKVAGKRVESVLPNEKYYSFLGIPYAEPPVGELRFKSPKPRQSWTGVLEAKKERKACPQFYLPVRSTKKIGFFGDEDCLYLSVHTPNVPEPNQNLPTIVFLYNEQFRISFNGTKDYNPDFFMKENVIVVTLHHRIGALGFLSFGDEVLPGNYGLRDVLLALKWIQQNIKRFGGDPSKVTLMGSQGGGAIADLLLQSPKAEGLFSGVILQSGSSWNPLYLDTNPSKRAKGLGEALEEIVTTSSYFLKRLADFSAQAIAESEHLSIHADEARSVQRGLVAFGPSIEPDHPEALVTTLPEEANFKINVPVMIGYNSREAIEIGERILNKPQYLTFADRDFLFMLPIRVKFHFQINDNVYYDAIEKIKEFYFDGGYIKISKPGEFLSYLNDISVFYNTDYAVRKYTNISSFPVYYYVFDYSGELNMRKKASLQNAVNLDGTWGASAGDELCYLFMCNPRKVYKKLLEDEDSEEIKVLTNMVKMWTNFAKTGNPTPPGSNFTWKPATKDNRECLVISDELEMKSNINEDIVKFWDEFISNYSEKAVDNIIKDEVKDEL
ncbi:PREDICTED: esterase E4-like [Papilio xuthus]|uniref:Esterase E4-like n=1 Tax=Papilio xuthus TaxID=66420 RepID=A0AAJ6Z0P7_PAPXU|nr:PREDICTED: esterase E4-like [Papilio xuthus]